jgi:hypothetical protein
MATDNTVTLIGNLTDDPERHPVRQPLRGSGPHRGLADRLQQPPTHSAHGWLTPAKFVERWVHGQQLQLA